MIVTDSSSQRARSRSSPVPQTLPGSGPLGCCWGQFAQDYMDVSEEGASQVYVCPACGGRMKIAGATPRASDLPSLLTFQCLDCNEVITIEDDYSGLPCRCF